MKFNFKAKIYGINEKGDYVAQPKKPKNPKIEKGKVALEAQFEKEKITTVKQLQNKIKEGITTPEAAAETDKLLAQFITE